MNSNPNKSNYDSMGDDEFRQCVREFVESHYPDIPRYVQHRLHWNTVKPWYEVLSKNGWICPAWSREHGGMGLSAGKQLILTEEYERYGCARVNDIGIVMLGPLLIKHGTDAQRDFFLPKILSGEHVWAQGYSEPGAGSDLASLRTQAVLDNDAWVINGQKTWTTLAMDANWIFILARTDKTVKKQAGISFILIPMNAPGVTVRPIQNLEMHEDLCEVFFDNVRVPADYIVGAVNSGWTISKALLEHERVFIGAPRLSASALTRLTQLAQATDAWHDPAFRDRHTQLSMDLHDLTDLFEMYVEKLRDGSQIGADVAILKIVQSELYQRISEELISVAGEDAGHVLSDETNQRDCSASTYLAARSTTIFGGSNEIMRNVLAKVVLGLPV